VTVRKIIAMDAKLLVDEAAELQKSVLLQKQMFKFVKPGCVVEQPA